MKRLTLLRHAKAKSESPDGSDFGRPLADRGRRDAARMGQEMRRLGLRFDLMLASPARRVVETVEQAGGLAPTYEPRIYEASPRQLHDLIRSTDGYVERLLMVGHNPGFELLAAQLTATGLKDFPTGSLAEIDLPANQWPDVELGSGRLIRFVTPKDLA